MAWTFLNFSGPPCIREIDFTEKINKICNSINIYFRFGDLENEEYIYKEKILCKLPEIAHRLEHFYCDKYGKDNVVIIKDSKLVEQSKLDPQKAYVQITYVEPYFDEFELRDRKTPFEQNFKLSKYL